MVRPSPIALRLAHYPDMAVAAAGPVARTRHETGRAPASSDDGETVVVVLWMTTETRGRWGRAETHISCPSSVRSALWNPYFRLPGELTLAPSNTHRSPPTTARRLHKILCHFKALLWKSIILLFPPPQLAKHSLLQYYCTIIAQYTLPYGPLLFVPYTMTYS